MNSNFKKLILSHAIIFTFLITYFTVVSYGEDINSQEITRLNGITRYETSVKISNNFENAENIILVSGEDFPDALVSSSLSHALNSPILLTSKKSLPTEIYKEIKRLNPSNIYIIGGENSIPTSTLKNISGNIIRISGEDRYDTSLKVYEKSLELGSSSEDIIITNGSNFPDALSSSNIIKDKNYPILLINDSIPENIQDKNIISVGGIKNIDIKNLNINSIVGNNRFETSVKVMEFLDKKPTKINIVSGENYPDALTASSLDTPIVLTAKKGFDKSTLEYLKSNKFKNLKLIGGNSTLPESLVDQLIGLDEDNFQNVKLPNKLNSNHNGKIMVLTMHDVSRVDDAYNRTPEALKADILNLYKKGYLPISLREYVNNDINIPKGYSPYVIVLDDGTESKFRIKSDGSVDEDSAFGVFTYMDSVLDNYKTKATFFISGKIPFMQKEYVQKKMDMLLDNKMEIGNHTYNHIDLSKNPSLIEKEIALQKQNLEQYLPSDYQVDMFAIPFSTKFSKKDSKRIFEGQYKNIKYKNIAVAEGGWTLSNAPQKVNFNNYFIPRIPISRSSNQPIELYDFLEYLDKNPQQRYVK